MAFVALYVERAEESEPATWSGLLEPRVAKTVSELWGRAEKVMASSCGIPNFGTQDKALIRQFCQSEAAGELAKNPRAGARLPDRVPERRRLSRRARANRSRTRCRPAACAQSAKSCSSILTRIAPFLAPDRANAARAARAFSSSSINSNRTAAADTRRCSSRMSWPAAPASHADGPGAPRRRAGCGRASPCERG